MTDFQDPKELERYLKTAAELECSAYRLQRSIDTANAAERELEQLCKGDPARYVAKPEQKAVEPPAPPSQSNVLWLEAEAKKTKKKYSDSCLGTIFYIVFGAGSLLLNSAMYESSVFLVALAVLFFVAALFLYCEGVRPNGPAIQKKKNEEYERGLLRYKEALAKYEKEDLARYEEEKAEREAQFIEEKKEYNKKVVDAKILNERRKRKIDATHNSISKMQETLDETKATLEKVYGMDVVHSKYRNMVAMCSICEYFETGRCTSLKGADGAYNLYEAELRQNMIIGRLDTIIDKLDEIKNSQYMLYCELKKTNQILRAISREVESIASTTESIAQTSNITAVCTQAAAKNTEALKYIALVS